MHNFNMVINKSEWIQKALQYNSETSSHMLYEGWITGRYVHYTGLSGNHLMWGGWSKLVLQ